MQQTKKFVQQTMPQWQQAGPGLLMLSIVTCYGLGIFSIHPIGA